MRKYNAYFPIWLLLMLPPLLFVTLGLNLVTCSIGILFVCFLSGKYKEMPKSIFSIWVISLILDILTLIVLILPELFNNVDFIKNNLIIPLEINPYKNFLSIIYIVLLVVLLLLISKKLISNFVVKKFETDENKGKIFAIILMAFSFPYLFFIPSSLLVKREYTSLADFKGTIMINKKNVERILTYLETKKYMSSYVLETSVEPYTINIYLKDTIVDYQLLFEKDASLIFYIVDDVNEVIFYYNDSKYVYTINSINLIYKNIKKLNLSDISERYNNDKFEKYTYLGNIKGYDVFDTSESCELDSQYIFSYFNVRYYLNCSPIDEILLYKGKEKITLKEVVDKEIITPDDFMKSVLDIRAEGE